VADKNIKVGLQLGVLGTGQLKSAFGQTRREVENLKGSTDRLGRANRAAADSTVSFATRGRLALAKLRGGYDGLTRSLGGLRMAAMAAAAVPVALGVNKALSLQDLSVDLAMTAGLDAAFEKDFVALIQSSARSGNQTQDETGAGAKALVDGGVRDLQSLGEYLPVLTQATTATRASMQSLANVALATRDNLGMSASGFKSSLDMMVFASGKGKMGVQAMANAIPQLSLRMKDLPEGMAMTGEAMMTDLLAGLQVARMGANTDDEAARNLNAFMERIFSPETRGRFESKGVLLENSIKNLTAKGFTPLEAMLDTVTTYVSRKSPEALAALNSAMNMGEGEERDAAFSALSSRYDLGDLFVDEGVKNFMIAAMQNRQMLRDLKQGASEASGQDLLGADFIRRMGSAREQMKGLGLALSDVGVTLSGPIVDGLLSAGLAILPMVQGAAAWVQQNPELVKSVVTVAGALLGARLAISGVGLMFKAGKWFVGGFTGAAKTAGATLVWLKNGLMATRHVWLGGLRNLTLSTLIWGRSLRVTARTALGATTGAARTLAHTLGGALMTGWRLTTRAALGWGRALWVNARVALAATTGAAGSLARLLGGALLTGLRVTGQAMLWVGRALALNPIGLAITAIAGGAFLLIKYWGPISGFFKGLWDSVTGIFKAAWEGITGFFDGIWQRITDAFDGGIAGIGKLILDWSPLGLFYKAFAGVLGWFGVELPDDFSEFGSQVIDSFTSGITDVFGSAWQGVTGVFDAAWQGLTSTASGAWDGITNVASSAWQSATGVFDSTWQSISGLFDGGIEGISKTIVDWSPLNLFQKGLDGVMDWFGVDLPESFTGFGGMLVDGLTGGVTNAFTKAKETITNFGNSIKGWFSSVLDIKSPSRVFMELGGFVSEGAALGIRQQIPLAGRAVAQLSGTIADAGAGLIAPAAATRVPALNGAAPASTTIQFSPVVHITAAPGASAKEQAGQFVDEARRLFDRWMGEREHRQHRTAMAGAY